MGYSGPPPPIEEVGFPDVQKSLFSHGFPEKIHIGTQNPDYFCFVTLDFQEKLQNNKWNSRLFAFVALTSFMERGHNLSGMAQYHYTTEVDE